MDGWGRLAAVLFLKETVSTAGARTEIMKSEVLPCREWAWAWTAGCGRDGGQMRGKRVRESREDEQREEGAEEKRGSAAFTPAHLSSPCSGLLTSPLECSSSLLSAFKLSVP